MLVLLLSHPSGRNFLFGLRRGLPRASAQKLAQTRFVDSCKMATVYGPFRRNAVADSLDPNATEETENYLEKFTNPLKRTGPYWLIAGRWISRLFHLPATHRAVYCTVCAPPYVSFVHAAADPLRPARGPTPPVTHSYSAYVPLRLILFSGLRFISTGIPSPRYARRSSCKSYSPRREEPPFPFLLHRAPAPAPEDTGHGTPSLLLAMGEPGHIQGTHRAPPCSSLLPYQCFPC